MKKILMLIVVLITVTFLVSCSNEENTNIQWQLEFESTNGNNTLKLKHSGIKKAGVVKVVVIVSHPNYIDTELIFTINGDHDGLKLQNANINGSGVIIMDFRLSIPRKATITMDSIRLVYTASDIRTLYPEEVSIQLG